MNFQHAIVDKPDKLNEKSFHTQIWFQSNV